MRNTAAVSFTVLLSLIAASCGFSTTTESTVVAGQLTQAEDDDRSLEEKVDTDGDGEMSEEEIGAYARSVLLDFSDCMRENGYPEFTDLVLEDLTEGTGSGQGRFLRLLSERGVTIPDGVPTLQMCGKDLSDLQTFAPQPSDDEVAEQEAAVLEFAACVRSEGVSNWPDPDFAANGGNGYGAELFQEVDIQSDEVQSAIATCQAASGAAIDVGSEGDEDDEDETDDAAGVDTTDARSSSDTADGTDEPESAEEIDRAPISPLIEGDTGDLNVAEVARRDLVQTKTFAATLGHGQSRPFPTNTTGIITALPDEGDIIEFGEVLFAVDGQPVVLLEGDTPQYRSFNSRMSDGPDVEQLERNLIDLGYADESNLTVDTDFTNRTVDAIEAMQLELGGEETGELALGRVVFAPRPIRVGAVNVKLGQMINPQVNPLSTTAEGLPMGRVVFAPRPIRVGAVKVELGQTITPQVTPLSVTESDQRITLDLDAEDLFLLPVDTEVEIELPDGTVVPGRVSDVAAVATQTVNQQGIAGDPTTEVTIVFADGEPNEVFDAAPVDVIVTDEVSADVLTVPVPALIALAGGGHAVELIVEGGTQLIGVRLGDFVDDLVEISGDVQPGDRVVMAGR